MPGHVVEAFQMRARRSPRYLHAQHRPVPLEYSSVRSDIQPISSATRNVACAVRLERQRKWRGGEHRHHNRRASGRRRAGIT
jgi:hypothetical protein